MERDLFICQCGDPNHQLIVSRSKEYTLNKYYFVTIKLTKGSFWKRLKVAFNYIFNIPSVYSEFDNVILSQEDAKKLANILTNL